MKVYYNKSCNICRAEIKLYKKEKIKNIDWVDITHNKRAEKETKKRSTWAAPFRPLAHAFISPSAPKTLHAAAAAVR